MLRALFSKNTCKTCALGMGGQQGGMRDEKGHFPSVCNKSFQAQAADMQAGIPGEFFEQHDVNALGGWSPRALEHCGRLTQPLILSPGENRYRPINWEQAFDTIVDKFKSTASDRAFFYASGRSSNEAGFLLQLFARLFGTNHINNCSYFCHQASGVGLTRSLGTSTATVELDDLDHADLIFLAGANPASNHPRFMRVLMETRRRGGKVIVVNPARERGLENFSVPSDIRSLLLGSEIASTYLQPNIGGDIALFKGIAKALLEGPESALADQFIDEHTEHYSAFREDLKQSQWQDLEASSGIPRNEMEQAARDYASANNVIFAWAMGITHHSHGVDNVQAIVNLALMRGMVGRKHSGLLPLRGHSNVQGIGSVGVTPKLKQAVIDNLASQCNISVSEKEGLDTLGAIEAIQEGQFDIAWNLGGNLFGSNPDSNYAEQALQKLDLAIYMNTTLNPGHFRGAGKTTLILPVLARDEEPAPTTQESMFSYVRLSEGGEPRHAGPKSEVEVIAEIGSRVLPPAAVLWPSLKETAAVRQLIASVIPGFDKIADIERPGGEFHIDGRILHTPSFPTESGKAAFSVCPVRPPSPADPIKLSFQLMTVRSEGQFNTVVYEEEDRYRGVRSRDVVLMNPEDMEAAGLKEGERVRVKNPTGKLERQKIQAFPIRSGNIMMYYPEANVLVPRSVDPASKTPSFKSVSVILEKDPA